MVREDIARAGVTDAGVLRSFSTVPREEFVPTDLREFAYDSFPLPITSEQTCSQPIVVAIMTELAEITPGERVLEIGTGTGYQTAILSQMGAEVFSIEIVEPVARAAARRLARLGYDGVEARVGDGYQGWPEQAPFDAIIVTAASPQLPLPLAAQLGVDGRLVAPIGAEDQTLVLVVRRAGGFECSTILPVHFVSMQGEAAYADPGVGGTPIQCR